MMLQYVESSVASHLMVVPKKPKMPDPKIPPPPPPLRKLPFAIIIYGVLVMYWLCVGYVLVMSGLCVGYVLVMCWLCVNACAWFCL